MDEKFNKISTSTKDGEDLLRKRKRADSLDHRPEQYIIEETSENEVSFCNGKDFSGKNNITVVSSNREESLWIKSIENVVKSVVSIRFSQVNLYKYEFFFLLK